jgi:TM2 domain-containing membrane protein YozV
VQCNSCGKALCPACDHRIKGFPYCQDCIVLGVDMLRQQNNRGYSKFVSKKTSPIIATLLSFIMPGLGAAYNGQTVKALVYFAIFIGLFQMAVMTGTVLFAFGSMGMWLFAALDSWRTAQMIRSGLTPDIAEDIFVRRFSGNPKLWGILLGALGVAFLLQSFLDLRGLMRAIVPALLIGLGIYILRDYIFKPKKDEGDWSDFDSTRPAPLMVSRKSENYAQADDLRNSERRGEQRFGGWRDR